MEINIRAKIAFGFFSLWGIGAANALTVSPNVDAIQVDAKAHVCSFGIEDVNFGTFGAAECSSLRMSNRKGWRDMVATVSNNPKD